MDKSILRLVLGPDASLLSIAEKIRASYWFLPSLMVVFAILLASLTQWLDGRIDPDWLRGLGWLYSNQTVGARSVLSTIAASMITVAGVTFSMTIVSVSYASAQFGPRLVTNFMRDRGNQITLGTFIATFVFCLMVLRGVRDGVEADENLVAFIPHISVLVAVVLALASIAVLIYFIHHVPETINVGNIVARLGADLKRSITARFPEDAGFAKDDSESLEEHAEFSATQIAESATVRCERSGYVQSIDEKQIMSLAVARDLIIRVEFLPGDFSLNGEALAHAWPKGNVRDEDLDGLRAALTLSVRPASAHNPRFLVDQLVEIIGRALSPGVNDPYTAINCMNWLMDSLATAIKASPPQGERTDESGNLRIVANAYDFEQLTASIFDQSRQYICADRNVTLHVLHMITTVGAQTTHATYRKILNQHAQRLADAAYERIGNTILTIEIKDAANIVAEILEGEADLHALRESRAWLGGSA